MSKLIIIRGNSGSGKTSAAKSLQKRFGRNTMLISQDIIRREMLWVKGDSGTDIPLLIYLLKYGKQNSDVTILEGILDAEFYKPLFETAVKEYGLNIFAYYYDLTFEETLLRHNTKPNRFDFGEEDMRRWWKEKDFLDIISETILNKNLSLSDTVEMIYKRVSAI